MKGDFTRNTFDPAKHFSRVLSQQGRVTLDADPNEQTSIVLHYLRTLTRDLLGPYAVPAREGGFDLNVDESGNLIIRSGRMYVDGILVENDADCAYAAQPDYPLPEGDSFLRDLKARQGNVYWLYLDVWERHITALEDPKIREVALNGPDTCTRAKVVWQVKALPQPNVTVNEDGISGAECDAPLAELYAVGTGTLAARVDPGYVSEDACIQAPDAKYRGAENQLYRVEVHEGGSDGAATFKWSRDNGSVATPLLSVKGGGLEVGRTRGFSAGDWVEALDDVVELHGGTGLFLHVARIEDGILSIDEDGSPSDALDDIAAALDTAVNPKLRRWDQRANDQTTLVKGAVQIPAAGEGGSVWIDLEDGIQVQFGAGTYRTGDYWLIPARIATGNVEWPTYDSAYGAPTPAALPPQGIEHHYAPLGFLGWSNQNFHLQSCRCTFDTLTPCFVLDDGASPRGNVQPIRSEEVVVAQPVEGDNVVTKPKGGRKKPTQ